MESDNDEKEVDPFQSLSPNLEEQKVEADIVKEVEENDKVDVDEVNKSIQCIINYANTPDVYQFLNDCIHATKEEDGSKYIDIDSVDSIGKLLANLNIYYGILSPKYLKQMKAYENKLKNYEKSIYSGKTISKPELTKIVSDTIIIRDDIVKLNEICYGIHKYYTDSNKSENKIIKKFMKCIIQFTIIIVKFMDKLDKIVGLTFSKRKSDKYQFTRPIPDQLKDKINELSRANALIESNKKKMIRKLNATSKSNTQSKTGGTRRRRRKMKTTRKRNTRHRK